MGWNKLWPPGKDTVWFAIPVLVTALWLVGLDTFYSFTPDDGIFVRFFGRGLLLIAAFPLMGAAVVQISSGRTGLLIGIAASVLIAWAISSAQFLLGDYLHLAAEYSNYRQQIERTPGLKPISFDWGGTGFLAAGNSSRTLVYDPTHALSGQIGIHEKEDVAVRTRHLVGSFYTVEEKW